jgi:hypothetical protein
MPFYQRGAVHKDLADTDDSDATTTDDDDDDDQDEDDDDQDESTTDDDTTEEHTSSESESESSPMDVVQRSKPHQATPPTPTAPGNVGKATKRRALKASVPDCAAAAPSTLSKSGAEAKYHAPSCVEVVPPHSATCRDTKPPSHDSTAMDTIEALALMATESKNAATDATSSTSSSSNNGNNEHSSKPDATVAKSNRGNKKATTTTDAPPTKPKRTSSRPTKPTYKRKRAEQ